MGDACGLRIQIIKLDFGVVVWITNACKLLLTPFSHAQSVNGRIAVLARVIKEVAVRGGNARVCLKPSMDSVGN